MANISKKEQDDALEYQRMWLSPIYFVQKIWKLIPQNPKPEFTTQWKLGLLSTGKDWDNFCKLVRPFWFEDYVANRHITWQQTLVLHGVEKAMRKQCTPRISIVSGHGIGKSTLTSWLILWFLFVNQFSQVAATSPGAEQMYDVLWKELKKWIDLMPEEYKALYIWESAHIRMLDAPQTWFARAKTSSKENTEALAGVHADWVMVAVDEASGVEEPIFETMEGALTSGNILVFLISNGTRNIGYFYDTHHKDKERWQTYQFNSEESPRVDTKYVTAIKEKYGEDSTQYAIRVRGEFPDEGVMDDKGYVQLFNEADIKIVPPDPSWRPVGRTKLGLDASGEGQDTSEWCVRDRMRAGILASEDKSSPQSMSLKTITLVDKYRIAPIDVTIDNFGKGADVAMEIALATANQMHENGSPKPPWRTSPLNVGDPALYDSDLYMNTRAMLYYRLMKWAHAGGEFMDTPGLKDELLSIRFRRTTNGRIQIMDKLTMKKLGFKSPNKADAISLTFAHDEYEKPYTPMVPRAGTSKFNASNPIGDF